MLVALLLLALPAPRPARALEPPRPGELARLQREGELGAAVARARALGNDQVAPALVRRLQQTLAPAAAPALAPAWPLTTDLPGGGTHVVPAVLIDFSDHPATLTTSQLASLLNGPGSGKSDLHDYYARSSYGKLDLRCDVLGVYHTGRARSSVDTSSATAETDLIQQAFAAFDATHDFSRYDGDGDGDIDYAVVFWTGPAGAWSSFWWGHFERAGGTKRFDGVTVGAHSWQWEPAGMDPTVVIHETGHALGLPDYYDYDTSVGPDGGVGSWDPMAGTTGDHCAFSKMMLGWLAPQVVADGSATTTLRPSSRYADAAVVMPRFSPGAPLREFFIAQTRQATLNDAVAPYLATPTALQIWHVDAVVGGGGAFLYDDSSTAHKLLRLMEADGREDIEHDRGSNAGDLYTPGTSFGPSTVPSSKPYWATRSGVAVTGISSADQGLRCTLTAGANDLDFTAPETTLTAGAGWHDRAVTLALTATDAGSGTAWTRCRPPGASGYVLYDAGSPAAITGDTGGLLDVRFYSQDRAGNLETAKTVSVGVDSRAPTLSRTGPPYWNDGDARAQLSASDAGASGVDRIEYRRDGDDWVAVSGSEATAVVKAAGNEGEHTCSCRAVDNAGNVSATDTFTLRIDTLGPTTSARPASTRRGQRVALGYTATDGQSPTMTAVKLAIRDRRGRLVRTIRVPDAQAGTWYEASWRPRYRGTYRYSVLARDLAGNRQALTGRARIVVR